MDKIKSALAAYHYNIITLIGCFENRSKEEIFIFNEPLESD
jgi:hypothetical protein